MNGFSNSGPGAPVPSPVSHGRYIERPTELTPAVGQLRPTDRPAGVSDEIDRLVTEVYEMLFGDYWIDTDPDNSHLLLIRCGRCLDIMIPVRAGVTLAHVTELAIRHERRNHPC